MQIKNHQFSVSKSFGKNKYHKLSKFKMKQIKSIKKEKRAIYYIL